METLLFRLASLLGIVRLSAYLNRKKPAILMYHGVRAGEGMPGCLRNHVPVNQFQRQIEYLAAHRQVVPLTALVQWLREGQPIPDYAVVLTFDDGYQNNYTEAYPVLCSSALPATVFLTTALIGTSQALWYDRLAHSIFHTSRSSLTVDGMHHSLGTGRERARAYRRLAQHLKHLEDAEKNQLLESMIDKLEADLAEHLEKGDWPLLTWPQVQEMQQNGILFGSHTEHHVILTRVPAEVAEAEVRLSKRMLKEQLKVECTLFCYPNGRPGDYDDKTRRILQDAGFQGAVLAVTGLVESGDDPLAMRRIGVPGDESYWHFVASLSGLRLAYLHFKRALRRVLQVRK